MTKTENGGVDWSIIDIPLKNVTTNRFILSESKISIYGQNESDEIVLISSIDFGKTWQFVSKPTRHLTNLYFIDDNHAITDYERSEDGGRTRQASEVEMGYDT